MGVRICTWIVGFLLVLSVACNKPSQPNQSQDANSAAPADNSQAAGNSASPDQNSSQQANSQPAPPPRPVSVTIPAGKTITIRLADEVGSKVSQQGQTFGGSLVDPVTVNGETVIPAGSRVQGVVVDAKGMGHFAGGALLQLTLNSITVHGVQLPVQTSTFSQTLKGKGKRTGIITGGGAGLGAIIGGIAGGGKGAAIGAAAGGGAGAAGSAYTGNKEIVLPAESAVAFKLSAPLTVKR